MSKTAEQMVMGAVESLPNLVKVVKGGKIDTVIRIDPLESRVLDLDRTEEQEEWENIKRLVYLKAPLEQRNLDPVATGDKQNWLLLPEQVPVVKLQGEVPDDLLLNSANREHKLHLKNLEKARKNLVEKRGPGRPKKSE